MKRSASLLSILFATACTQPAAMVELRGGNGYERGGSSYNTAMSAPVSSVSSSNNSYIGAQPVYNASHAKENESAAIGVSDLEPASGKAPVSVSASPAAVSHGSSFSNNTVQQFGSPKSASTVAQVDHYDSDLEDAKTGPKEVTLTKADDAAPVNAWTKKPRDADAFANDSGTKPAAKAAAADAKFIWPVTSHSVSSATDGITIAAKEGEPVWASADGEIVYADNKMKGYGNMVLVKHHGGKTTTYAHLARISVDKYDRVKQGDIIGYVGKTGNVKKPQLYFSMRDGTKSMDPQKYLDRNVAGL